MTDPGYFEDLYRDDPDPWRLASSPYERRKRAVTVSSLPREHYGIGFEPACATGQLTAMVAHRCDRLIACDPVQHAVDRVAALEMSNVEVTRGAIPVHWPDVPLDLVVLSEVLYFLGPDDRAQVARRTARSLTPGGHVVAVHWRHWFEESATPPAHAHDDLHATGLRLLVEHLEDDFRLEVFERA